MEQRANNIHIHRRLQDGHVVSMVEVLVVIQYSVLVVTSGYTKKCSGIKGSMSKVMKFFVCRGCMNPVISTGCTSVELVPVQIWS